MDGEVVTHLKIEPVLHAESTNSARILAFFACVPLIVAVCMPFLDFHHMWVPLAASLGLGICFFFPIQYSIFAYFVFLFLEGALKINSNYNPLAQLGGDILIAVLSLRSFLDRSSGGISKIARTPYFKLIVIFWVWVFLQYLNPFGLGLLPSIAGLKIYVTMTFFFFLCYHHLDRENFDALLLFLVLLGIGECAATINEYLRGQEWIFSIHPRYRTVAGLRFIGPQFRPFGTTAIPGAPAVFISILAPVATYLLIKPGKGLVTALICATFLLLGMPALILCQIRTSMVLFAIGAALVAIFPGQGLRQRYMRVAACLGVVISIVIPPLQVILSDNVSPETANKVVASTLASQGIKMKAGQIRTVLGRLTTLSKRNSYSGARDGALAAMLRLAKTTVFGIGLSRAGAASSPWESRIAADPYFGKEWSFADNLYRYIFVELGLPGLIAWLLMAGAMTARLFKLALSKHSEDAKDGQHFLSWMCGISVFLLLLSGFGSEGVLYTPVSAFFWLFLAIGLKRVVYGT
jgi:hypothetical protein